jgi:hypothetical protein
MTKPQSVAGPASSRMMRFALIAGVIVALVIATLALASGALSAIVRERAVNGLKDTFGADLQFKNLTVALFPRIVVTAEDVVFRQEDRPEFPPLITIRKLTASTNPLNALRKHVGLVTVEGLQLHVPPRRGQTPPAQRGAGSGTRSAFAIDEVIADGTALTIIPKDSAKEPLEFEISRLRLNGAGPSSAMSFHADLRNARPPGDIHSDGSFGPWVKEEPGDTPVSGTYTFRNADLSVFKGIAGTLSSDGKYSGVLQYITADGTTDTPDFSVKISGNPVDLKTRFHAIVDGTNGDTLLQPVDAQFGHSELLARGGVEQLHGTKGKTVSLDVTATHARVEDLLRLGASGKAMMSGLADFHTKLVVPPGPESIEQKLKLDGAFDVGSAQFKELNVQEKVNKLSHSGQGDPTEDPDATVASDFAGRFTLDRGVMTFQSLSFTVPGVGVSLSGKYGVADGSLDFQGTARLDAKLSQATTGIKSFLLKAVNPLFERHKAGAVLPIKITGTRDAPSFGLNLRPK